MKLDALKWDAAGLVTVVVQSAGTGEVRMVAHASREAVERTLATGEGYFYSRSRRQLWRKGESSGHTLAVREVWADCDGDALLYLVEPTGPSCHTGARSCFFTPLEGEAVPVTVTGGSPLAAPTLLRLEDTLASRVERTAEKSYTKSLLEHGAGKIGAKLREEADELAEALARETDERVVSETADVVYHALVGLLSRRLHFRDVAAELARRFGTSGHDEKASRPR